MSRNFDILQKHLAENAGIFPPQMPQPQPNDPAQPEARAAYNNDKDQNGDANVANDNTLSRPVHEEIMKLVQRVFILPGAAQAPAILAFCGIDRGVGCSWVCARAAETLARQDAGTVCVVDANVRNPSLHSHFACENNFGFADAVRDSRSLSEIAHRLPAKNLWLITAGKIASEPNGALNASRLRMRVTELRSVFDYVLFDMPAADAYPDAVPLAQLTDGIILIVGSNSTRRETARIAKENLQSARVPMFGAVLNRRTFPIPGSLYRHL